MTDPAAVDATRCAICGKPNDCALASGREITECWCATAAIGPEALMRVPEEKRGRVCLCPECAAAD